MNPWRGTADEGGVGPAEMLPLHLDAHQPAPHYPTHPNEGDTDHDRPTERRRAEPHGGGGVMRVLVACEYSGVVRDAFRALGHDAMSCDILPTERPGPHYQGDVLELRHEPFDLVIAHPPCTYLSNSGVRWLSTDPARWPLMFDGAEFFAAFWEFNTPRLAVENPVQHGYARRVHGKGKATQYVQPWMHGHPEQKATGLWLRGLPKLTPTNDVREEMGRLTPAQRQRVWSLSPGPDRWKERSATFPGIAAAMAAQWTDTNPGVGQ